MLDNTRRLVAASRPARIVGTRSNSWHGGAVGAGRVLVVLPSIALVIFIDRLAQQPTVGLPVLAIFSIMILLGALALTSSLSTS